MAPIFCPSPTSRNAGTWHPYRRLIWLFIQYFHCPTISPFTRADRGKHRTCRWRHLPHSRLAPADGRLEQALDSLAAQLEQLELLEAHVYPPPAVPQGQEHEPIEQIEVGYLGEETALAATLSAYRDHSARPGCSTKATHRLPGWLRFPAACAPAAAADRRDQRVQARLQGAGAAGRRAG